LKKKKNWNGKKKGKRMLTKPGTDDNPKIKKCKKFNGRLTLRMHLLVYVFFTGHARLSAHIPTHREASRIFSTGLMFSS
jgi:hypothetical protein